MRGGGAGGHVAADATVDGPTRRRQSWNLRNIVEDVAGRPIEELQDPTRPMHPYLKGKIEPPAPPRATSADEPPYDPVDNLYPPLVGPAGRAYHGPEHEHHRETLERHRPREGIAGGRGPGPSQAPERLYLHYLLLHMDRLNDSGLRYLRRAVDEELAHRGRPLATTLVVENEPADRAVGP
jgi:hypothetical protein